MAGGIRQEGRPRGFVRRRAQGVDIVHQGAAGSATGGEGMGGVALGFGGESSYAALREWFSIGVRLVG
eukprot:38499-Amorphochlora_amoeboformis.AAC.1